MRRFTYMIEHIAQERILELYLNVAEWGVGCSAPRRRPGIITIPARRGWAQARRPGWLPCCPIPATYDRHRNTGYLNSRTATLTRRMRMVEIP